MSAVERRTGTNRATRHSLGAVTPSLQHRPVRYLLVARRFRDASPMTSLRIVPLTAGDSTLAVEDIPAPLRRHGRTRQMKRAVVTATVTSLLVSGAVAGVAAHSAAPGAAWTGLRAGVGVVDASWHLGAGAGQYASTENPTDVSSEWDPNVEHVKQQ